MGGCGRIATAAILGLAGLGQVVAQTVNNGVGSYTDAAGGFSVNWVADEATQTITATFTAQTIGWVSLGLSNNAGGHNTVDTVVAWVDDVEGTLVVIDGSMNNANGFAQPIPDGQQDWLPVANPPPAQDATSTTFALSRPFITNNVGQDADFENGNQYLHWAIGLADGTIVEGEDATYDSHAATPAARGAVPVNFRQGAAGDQAPAAAGGEKVFLGLDMTELIIIGGGGGAAVLMVGGGLLVYGGGKKSPPPLPMSSKPPALAPAMTPSPSPPMGMAPMGGMGMMGAPPPMMGGMGAPMGGMGAAPMGGMGAAPMGGMGAAPMGGMGAAPMGGMAASPMGGMAAAPMAGGMAPTPAPRADPAPAAGGVWKTAKDNNGVMYYYNKTTGQSQYEAPPGMAL